MKAIFFDQNYSKIEILQNASIESVKNYFLFNEAAKCSAITSDNLQENLRYKLIDNIVYSGEFVEVEKFDQISGIFDLEYYSTTDDELDELTQQMVNENLLYIFNGGNIEDVPNPMPYIKNIPYKSQEFIPSYIIDHLELIYRKDHE